MTQALTRLRPSGSATPGDPESHHRAAWAHLWALKPPHPRRSGRDIRFGDQHSPNRPEVVLSTSLCSPGRPQSFERDALLGRRRRGRECDARGHAAIPDERDLTQSYRRFSLERAGSGKKSAPNEHCSAATKPGLAECAEAVDSRSRRRAPGFNPHGGSWPFQTPRGGCR